MLASRNVPRVRPSTVRVNENFMLPPEAKSLRSGESKARRGSFQRASLPGDRSTLKFVRRPVLLVELERDHVDRVVPGDGLQAQRGAIFLAADGGQEGIEVWRRLA